METTTFNPVEISRGVSEYGFMVVASSCFLITSVTTMILYIRWLMRIINNIIETQQQSLKELLQSLKEVLQSSKEQTERQREQGKVLDEVRSTLQRLANS